MLALASSGAAAQTVPSLDISAAVKATEASTDSLGTHTAAAVTSATAEVAAPALTRAVLPVQQVAAATITAAVRQPASAQPVSSALAPAIAREAAWLYHGGWPLYALVERYSSGAALDEQETCLATAVYFEARGESAEGQLAVARVVMNRAASGKYPPSWCETVKQPAQFSFVRNGRFPAINTGSDAWRKAQAIVRLAVSNVVPSLSGDVLWYHANYVAPSWGRRLTRAEKIGAHIFYRS
jgi:spore germination cell wall hydrolase CwlJ-like protein